MKDCIDSCNVVIRGLGTYLPEKVLTNKELTSMVDTSEEWISTRTGIIERRIAADNECTSDLALHASKKAIIDANLSPEDIDLIVVATVSPDMPFPATATILQAKLGMPNVAAFDVVAVCSGFVYALDVACSMLKSGMYKRALVVGAEKFSSVVDWQDRSTCVIFGDGAGAFILERSNQNTRIVVDSILGSDGSMADLLCIPAGGSKIPTTEESVKNRLHFMKMNGKETFKVAVRWMEKSILDLLERNNLKIEDVACIIPHQANVRIIDALSQRLGLSPNKVFCNIQKVGNTSAASIPIAFVDAMQNNLFKSGDNIVLVAFGGGLTWGSTLIKW